MTSMLFAKGTYSLSILETLTKAEWLSIRPVVRSDIRLALSESVVYSEGIEKDRVMAIQSKLTGYSMGVGK